YGLDRDQDGNVLPMPTETERALAKSGGSAEVVVPWMEYRDGVQLVVRPIPESVETIGIRVAIARKIKAFLGAQRESSYQLEPGGLTSININYGRVKKSTAVLDMIKTFGLDPKFVFFFGDEYMRSNSPDSSAAEVNGIHPIALSKAWFEGNAIRIGDDYTSTERFLAEVARRRRVQAAATNASVLGKALDWFKGANKGPETKQIPVSWLATGMEAEIEALDRKIAELKALGIDIRGAEEVKDEQGSTNTAGENVNSAVLSSSQEFKAVHGMPFVQMKPDWAKVIEDDDFDEVHIITAGGGGDVLGGIFMAKQLKRVLAAVQRKGIRFSVFTTNLKRGEENPKGGPTPMETIGTVSLGVFDALEPVSPGMPIYRLDRPNIVARTSVGGHSLPINIKEGGIVEKMKEWDIDLMILDISPGSRALAKAYKQFIEGKKVLSICLDMGGDILARYPYDLTDANKEKHPEAGVRSPVTDT
ncbi:MAG TPA: DUF1152 domain-containing protein, partial [Candidatus Omnitrophota bacterium]|nr:DUF1152 domain-containing protein [Candidatus Omnitrophota bacterium]